MDFLDSLKKLFGKPQAKPPATPPANSPANPPALSADEEPDPAQIVVPELTPAEVQAGLAGAAPPLLLDVREQYEWNQVHIAEATFIPMNQVPGRLHELPRGRKIVVFCAHGSRSFGVTHYLLEQGFDAANLAGGITQWQRQGGAVEVARR